MWLDADDIVTDSERDKIHELKKTLDPNTDIVTFKYHTHFDTAGNPILTLTRERLFNREKNFKWNDAIHEYITMSGNIVHSDIAISHKKTRSSGDRNLRIYHNMVKEGKEFSPRETYYYARELMDNRRYEEAINHYTKFLEDGQGWFEDNIATCFNLSRCYEALDKRSEILPILFKSFEYDTPRAEVCCQIAYFYKNKQDYARAINWFELALRLVKNSKGFVLNDYWDFIPTIELCVCYSKVNDLLKSYHYHQLSVRYKPNDSCVLHNEEYFKQIDFDKITASGSQSNTDSPVG